MNSHIYDKQDALERAGGDPHRAQRFLAMLLESLPQVEQSISRALDGNDAPALQEHAHRLAGAASYCGATAMREAAVRLEARAREGDPQWNSALANELMKQIARFRKTTLMTDS